MSNWKSGKLINHFFLLWNRIKFKLLLFGISMSIVPILVFGVYNIQMSKISLEENIKERQIYVAKRAASEINNLLNSIQGRMEMLIDTNDTANLNEYEIKEWQQSLYSLLKQNSEIENAYVFDENGDIFTYASIWEVNFPSKIEDNQYQRIKEQHIKDEDFFVGEVYFKEDGSPYVNIGVPFYSLDHSNFYGGMMIEVSLRSTFKKASSILTGKDGYIYIIDDKNRLIAHTDFSQVLLQKDVTGSTESNIPTQYTSYTGKQVVGMYEPISMTDWAVVIEQPVSKAYLTINSLVTRLIITMLIVISLVSLTSIIFGIKFTKPVELMGKAVQKVTIGKLNTKINYKSNDEFGKLAEAFNHMTNELMVKSEHLEQEKERLDTIINGSGAGFALIDDSFNIVWMNERLQEWLAPIQANNSCFDLLARLKQPCKDCPITNTENKQCPNEVINTVDKHGRTKIFLHRLFPLERVREGEPKYLVVVEDITEQKQMEEMVVQADKLSALGILASGFAHEVNNPLASISVYAEDLKERLKEEPPEELVNSGEIEHYLDIIRNNVERCKVITGSLLNFSRKSTFNSRELNLAKLIDDSILLMQHNFKKKQIKLIKKTDNDLPDIFGDDIQIQQVFVNLLQNSIDAMKESGTLKVTTVQKDETIEVHFKDNGCGMTKEQISKIFDPFYTTKPVGKGTGLGLYISYNIMKKLNGDIVINSEENVGTEVTVIFPRVKARLIQMEF